LLHLRHHRKSLPRPDLSWRELSLAHVVRSLWQPGEINWWIGTVFACGALLFTIGGILTLAPQLAASWGLSTAGANRVFFAGSIPFTLAAYLQLHQAANALVPPGSGIKTKWFGWHPTKIGWSSCALQFAGTLLFNINTYDAMQPDLNWLQQDLGIWLPDMAGSVLFLLSGYLAFVEYCRAYWGWQVHQLSWWITFANLLGCVAFMISALLAFVPQGDPEPERVTLSVLFIIIGAVGFLAGSLMMLPEAGK
jgi:hypothetical protein